MSYGLSGQLERVVTTTQNGSGTVTGRSRVDYRSNTQGIRTISVDWNDANLDGTFAAGERTGSIEYLIDNWNFTGYQQTILEVTKNSAGQATKRISYTFGTDEITQTVSTINPANGQVSGVPITQTFGHDGRGSVQVLFDAAAAIAQVYTYSAYGELLAIHNGAAAVVGTVGQANLESLAATNKLYNGEGFDTQTGLYNFRARNYSASLGRFERLDPFAGNSTDPFSFNKSAFVHGDPVQGTDPTGLSFGLTSLGSIGARLYLAGSNALASLNAFIAVEASIAAFVILHEMQQVLAAAGMFWTGRDENGTDLTPIGYLWAGGLIVATVIPGQWADDAYRRITAFRVANNLPSILTGDRATDGVVALLRIGGYEFVQQNGWINKTGQTLQSVKNFFSSKGVKANGISPTHAEGGVFYLAFKAVESGVQFSSRRAEIFVDSTFCKPCGEFKGLSPFLRALNIDELVVNIRLKNGHVVQGIYDVAKGAD